MINLSEAIITSVDFTVAIRSRMIAKHLTLQGPPQEDHPSECYPKRTLCNFPTRSWALHLNRIKTCRKGPMLERTQSSTDITLLIPSEVTDTSTFKKRSFTLLIDLTTLTFC